MIFDISRQLKLPADAVTQAMAILARRGAGKTYTAGKIAEEFIVAEAQVIVLDPVGNWYGLRLGADGKSKGLPVPVLGGSHGDLPLDPTTGSLVARVLIERNLSAVLDLSEMRKSARKTFVTDFAEEFFHRKKSSRSAVHMFFEEAQTFVPQRVTRGEERMLGAFEDLVKLGRNYGIGVTLISQRPQAVNKDVLNQVEVIFALQTNGSQERAALREWMREKSVDLTLLDELPSLPVGTAFVWSPSWLRIFKKVQIGKKITFDASATPTFGKAAVHQAKALASVDIESIREAFEKTKHTIAEDDPRTLRVQLAKLHQENLLLKKQIKALDESHQSAPEKAPAINPADIAKIEASIAHVEEAIKIVSHVPKELARVLAELGRRHSSHPRTSRIAAPRRGANAAHPANPTVLRKGARQMLAVLSMGPATRHELAVRAVMTPSSGTFSTYLSDLKQAHLIENMDDGRFFITEAGRSMLAEGEVDVPQTTTDLIQRWSSRFRAGARAMLNALFQAYPNGMSRDVLATSADMTMSGTFSTYLSDLRRNGLIEDAANGQIIASKVLFF